jgi:hypothetical protein
MVRELKYLNNDYERKHFGRTILLQTVTEIQHSTPPTIQQPAGFGTIDVYRSDSSEIVRIASTEA